MALTTEEVNQLRPGDSVRHLDGTQMTVAGVDLYRQMDGTPGLDRALMEVRRSRGLTTRWYSSKSLRYQTLQITKRKE